ncbi:MAG: CBS domain-containing protein [Nitrospirota bacterium]|nr:CBS domain-containing protein [Nitrospirota bacterium]
MLKTKDVMKKPAITIKGTATVYDAAKIMVETGVRGLIVEKRTENDAYGMVAIRDIIHEVIGKGLDPKKVKVNQIMSKPVVSVSPDMDIEYVARLLSNLNFARVAVIGEKDQLLGIISMMDILKAALHEKVRNFAGVLKDSIVS